MVEAAPRPLGDGVGLLVQLKTRRRGKNHAERCDRRRVVACRCMDRGVAVLLTAAAGGLIALQAPINAGLGKATGSLPAALVSFRSAPLPLAAIVVLSGKAGGLGSTFDVSWYYLLGGLLGAALRDQRADRGQRRSAPAGSPRRRSPASSPPRS